MKGTIDFLRHDLPLFILDLLRDLLRDFTTDREFLISELGRYEQFKLKYLAIDNKMHF
jgi:hypothetical protein